jgi:hypothetical protein
LSSIPVLAVLVGVELRDGKEEGDRRCDMDIDGDE